MKRGALAVVIAMNACAGPAAAPECEEGERRCDSSGTMEMVCLRNPEGELRYSQATPCPGGGRCEGGVCNNTCGPCETPPGPCHRSPGVCWSGKCRYDLLDDGQSCDDADACTSDDLCTSGQCKGKPRSCTTPPASTCKDPLTLTAHASPGACSGGECVYPVAEVPCLSGCVDGACKGDPCTDVKCETPPDAQCYTVPGLCSGGTCTYLPRVGADCDDADACTKLDKCDSAGVCAGTPYTCNDGLLCTKDSCDGTGKCSFSVETSSCLISNVCYASAAFKPGNLCEHCDPAASATTWTVTTGTLVQVWNFDNSTLQGWTVTPTTSPVKWQLETKRADSGTRSLYFGNSNTHTYDDPSKAVTGEVTSPAITLPTAAGKRCLEFKLWKHTEQEASFDTLKLMLLPANKEIWLSGTEPKNATTADAAGVYGFRAFSAAIPSAITGSVQFRFIFASGDAALNQTEGTYLDTIRLLKDCKP